MDLVGVTKTTSGNPFVTTTGNTTGNNSSDDSPNSDDNGGNNSTGGSNKSSASLSKPDRTLLAHGMAFIATSAFITSFL